MPFRACQYHSGQSQEKGPQYHSKPQKEGHNTIQYRLGLPQCHSGNTTGNPRNTIQGLSRQESLNTTSNPRKKDLNTTRNPRKRATIPFNTVKGGPRKRSSIPLETPERGPQYHSIPFRVATVPFRACQHQSGQSQEKGPQYHSKPQKEGHNIIQYRLGLPQYHSGNTTGNPRNTIQGLSRQESLNTTSNPRKKDLNTTRNPRKRATIPFNTVKGAPEKRSSMPLETPERGPQYHSIPFRVATVPFRACQYHSPVLPFLDCLDFLG